MSSGFTDGVNARVNRDRLYQEKRVREQELSRMGYSFDGNGNMSVRPGSGAAVEQAQFQEQAQLLQEVQSRLARVDTNNGLEEFANTGDASVLQRVLDNNPLLKKAWGAAGVQVLSNIDFTNDKNLLESNGLTPTMYDTTDKQNVIRKNMYKYHDGKEWVMGLLSNVVAMTGATRELGPNKSKVFFDNQQELRDLLTGPKVSPYTGEGHKYEKELQLASQETGIPIDALASIMAQESNGNHTATSHKGAQGLMQLMPATAKELGVTDPFDPQQNILAGAKYLKQNLDRYNGDLSLALAAYNAGPGNVDKYNGIPPFGETQDYVAKIMSNINEGQKYYGSTVDNLSQQIANNYTQPTTREQIILDAQRSRAQAAAGFDPKVKARELAIDEQKNQIAIDKNQIDREKISADKPTTKQKEFKAAEDETANLLEAFGGEQQFMSTDFTDAKNFRRAYPYITRIEAYEGTELSEADKKDYKDLKQLLALVNPASKITSQETGLIDSFTKDVNKYLTDNVKGTEATSAYAAIRNSLRNALYGSALTPGEIEAFNQAFGTLGQQEKPLKEAFKTALVQMQGKLDAMTSLQNPYSAKVRLGKSAEELQTVITALQARIDYLDGKESGVTKTQNSKGSTNIPKNLELDNIFGATPRT